MAGKPSWSGSTDEMILDGKNRTIKMLERDLTMAISLVKASDCKQCDGSGVILEGDQENPEWTECQWCSESKWLIENYKDIL